MENNAMISLTNSMMLRFSLRTLAAVGFLAVAYSTIAISARADNLVTNGGFELTTPIGAGNPSTANGGQLSYNLNPAHSPYSKEQQMRY